MRASCRSCKTRRSVLPVGSFGISSTTSIPPRSHLYLLKFSLCHRSSSFITFSFPQPFFASLPTSLRTTHALGTFSSFVRPPLTPATLASVMIPWGFERRQFSISTGETWEPDTFRVSWNKYISDQFIGLLESKKLPLLCQQTRNSGYHLFWTYHPFSTNLQWRSRCWL